MAFLGGIRTHDPLLRRQSLDLSFEMMASQSWSTTCGLVKAIALFSIVFRLLLLLFSYCCNYPILPRAAALINADYYLSLPADRTVASVRVSKKRGFTPLLYPYLYRGNKYSVAIIISSGFSADPMPILLVHDRINIYIFVLVPDVSVRRQADE